MIRQDGKFTAIEVPMKMFHSEYYAEGFLVKLCVLEFDG